MGTIKDILHMLWAGVTAYSLARLPESVQAEIIQAVIQNPKYQQYIDRPSIN